MVEAAISAKGTSKESISTEDVLSIVDKVALQILDQNLNQEDLFVGSLGAEALYPSLNIDKTAKLIGELIEEAGLKWEGVDFRWASICVAKEMDEFEVIRRNLQRVISRRRHGFGTKAKKASVKTIESDDKPDSSRWKFFRGPKGYTDAEKDKVLGALMECLVKTTFSTHYYLWKGKVHKQLEGGPIGLRGTGSCGKAVMAKYI